MMLKQNYYDQVEKPGRLPAWRIKQQQTEGTITNTEGVNGINMVDPLEINNTFKNFYENLYKSEYNI